MPLFNFGMPVGERKAAGPVMIGGGDVLPIVERRIVDEEAIIDGVRVFIKD